MANKFFQPGEERASKVQDLFGRVAPRYDLINDLQSFWLHRWWKHKLIELANPQPGERALDLCCGTGDVTFGLAARGVQATGLDFSEAMLAIARKRALAESKRWKKELAPSFVQADAENLPYADESFDIVTISYGLRNLSDWRRGLAEMHRVAKENARLLVLDFGKPGNPLWRRLYFSYLRRFVPLFGRIFCGDAETHAYILEALEAYPAQKGVAAAMEEIGCSNIAIHNLVGGMMSINYGKKK
jgi:demethylmenaquinone methyltransferase/2-methoxy-6-polyprenyl-1,4-benzoquinol methylase